MAQVSKRYLSPEVRERMYEIFLKAIGKARGEEDVVHFLTDLLSSTERIMLAKRLAIAYLLIKDKNTTREIAQILRVSLTTIDRVSSVLKSEGRGYRKIIKYLVREEQVNEFMEKLGELLPDFPLRVPAGYGTLPRYRSPHHSRRVKTF